MWHPEPTVRRGGGQTGGVLVYDGDCGFCTRSARWIEARLPLGYPVVAWQAIPDLAALGLTEADVQRAAWWIDTDGRAHGGARAIARALIACRGAWSLVGWALLVPPISWLATLVYALVARYRYRLPGATDACRLPAPSAPTSSGTTSSGTTTSPAAPSADAEAGAGTAPLSR